MTVTRTVPVTMPDKVWGRLASLADERGTTVGDLIAHAVEALAQPRYKRGEAGSTLAAQRLARIAPLRAAGLTWVQIAGETSIPYSSVMDIAKRNGLTRTTTVHRAGKGKAA